MRIALRTDLMESERRTLTRWERSRSTPARFVLQARIALYAAEGRENEQIARARAALGKTPSD
jgi:hypothetical protein